MAFNDAQVRTFAKQIWEQEFDKGQALRFLTPRLCDAILAERVFAIVRGQAADSVRVDTMNDLYFRVGAALRALSKNDAFLDY